MIEYVEHGLRLAPAVRCSSPARSGRDAWPTLPAGDDAATAFRELITELAGSSTVATAVSPAETACCRS